MAGGVLAMAGLAELGPLVVIACVLPLVMSLAILIAHWAWGTRLKIRLVTEVDGTSAGDQDMTSLLAEIGEQWVAERERAGAAGEPGRILALLHGVLASLGLLLSAALLQGLLSGPDPAAGLLQKIQYSLLSSKFHVWTVVELGGFAVTANITVHTALSYGRLFRRVSRRDLTPRAFADAIRNLLAGILVAITVLTLLQIERPWLGPGEALIAGGLMGLVGPPVLELIDQGTSVVFGLYSTSEDGLVDCTEVDGLDDVDRQRLQELGIDSLHSLAYASVPLMFLSSRYTYERICDWKDQALLQVLVGQELKIWLTRHRGIRCATDFYDWLAGTDPVVGLPIGEERLARLRVLLVNDRNVLLLRAWRRCFPQTVTGGAEVAAGKEPVKISR